VNLAHRGEDVLARVLKLLRFFETLFIRRFNPDEHPREVRFRKEGEQLLVLREIQRCLGAELEVVIVLALINAQVTEQLLGDVFVTDEVVVDEKYVSRAESAESIELASDLLARFRARLAPEHHDDVAELTAKWTAARELQADVRVTVELQQIESRRRRIFEGDHAFFFVERTMLSSLIIGAELFQMYSASPATTVSAISVYRSG